MMGQSQALYCVHSLETLQYSDLKPVKYLWIDKKAKNKQNQLYLIKFRQNFLVQTFTELQSFRKYVEISEIQGKERMRAICTASLSDQAYIYFQTKQSIDSSMLFCGNKTKASILMRHYSKIKLACFSYTDVIRTVKQWARQQTESIYFFNPQEIHKLNLAIANWRALTEINIAYTPQSFGNFIKMALKLFTFQDSESKVKKFSKAAEQAQNKGCPNWFTDYVIANEQYLNQVNTMLKSTKDPTKLAYVRWPVHKLFNSIKKWYPDQNNLENNSFYGVIELNQSQKQRLKKEEYICINQFILTSINNCYKQNDKNTIYIKIEVNNKGDVCNGFYCSHNAALFNLGNFFKIQSFSKNLLSLKLISLNHNIDIREGDVISGIFLNQAKAEKMQIIKQGQWYSLFLNGKQKQANQYIQRVKELKKKRNETENIICWSVIREKVKCDSGYSLAVSLKNLQQMLVQAQYKQKVLIYLAIAQIYIFNIEFTKFRKIIGELQTCMLKKPPLNQETTSQINLLRKFNEFLTSNQESKIEQLIQFFTYFEEELISKDKTNYLNKSYLLCLFISSCCLEKLQKYSQQIYVLNRILQLLAWTEGRQHYLFKLVNNYKRQAFQAINRKESDEQLKLKNTLIINQYLIEQLLQKDVPLKIDLSLLNMQLYD